ncbi:hypothetical protein PO902_17780 (plasmid) [Planococcus maritimus]|uniref:hypothetical protein n=1 Tax=Planococcus rifietoensis TaxID=200991 RepID=UPI00237F7805|nr:hypothetical protein [Planococcus sp. SK3692]MDE4086901.1 hypothetical protein [Planococcus maritimus]
MKRLLLMLFSVVLLSFGLGSLAHADELVEDESILPAELEEEGTDLGVAPEPLEDGSSQCSGGGGGVMLMSTFTPVCPDHVRDIKYTKSNVSTYKQWSAYKPVSAAISKGGTITSTKGETFGVVVSGAYRELGFSLNKSFTSTTGYSMTNTKYNVAHMGYRVMYSVETGTRVGTRLGRVVSRSSYKVKTPVSAHYNLVSGYPNFK